MRLKIRYPPNDPLIDILDSSKFSELRLKISQLVEIPGSDFIIKTGFPPAEIPAGDESEIREFLKDGDLLTIQKSILVGCQAVSKRPVPKKYSRIFYEKAKKKGAIHQINKSSIKQKRRDKNDEKLNYLGENKDSWAENILNIFVKESGSLNVVEKYLKGAFKSVISKRYRSSLAEKRWAAVQGAVYKIEDTPNYRFKVSFKISSRREQVEEYTALPRALLTAVVKEVYESGQEARNNLRPYYMAEAQPTLFWNLVRLFDGDLFKALRELNPLIDWSFVEDRRRDLSRKARQNLQQKQELDRIRADNRMKKEIRLMRKNEKDSIHQNSQAKKNFTLDEKNGQKKLIK